MIGFETKTIKKDVDILISNIVGKIYTVLSPLDIEIAVTDEPVPFSEKHKLKYSRINVGDCWAKKNFACGWMHITGKIPAEIEDRERVILVNVSGEACLFDKNGTPVRGLTNGSSTFDRSCGEPIKQVLFLNEIENDGQNIDVWIETASNDLFGIGHGGIIEICNFAYLNNNLRSLAYDFRFLSEYLDSISNDNPQYYAILYAMQDAASKLSSDFTNEEIYEAKKCLEKEMNKHNGDNSYLTLYACGHAHLDLAWLWPIRETKRKLGRTFANVVSNMNRYDDYIFGASQAQQFAWLKEYYPYLYDEVKAKIKEGRIEVQGGMWVEPDTNITSGESLIRQIIYGKEFFKKEFGVECKTCHLPDAFGFTGSLPQILRKSGFDYFLTTKLSWCEHFTYPHNSFIWEGIDGSNIIVHMPPADSYATSGSPCFLLKSQKNYSEKGLIDKAIILYGIGDGGGGPGRDHLERLKRAKDFLGLPKVKQSQTIDFFNELKNDRDKMTKWKGELYLDRHQGTLTSQSDNKFFNRLMEKNLEICEKISVLSMLNGNEYPKDLLDETWKEVLLYQFHDILPGSSIKRVYDESVARYRIMNEVIQDLTYKQIEKGDTLTVYNPTSFDRNEYIYFDGQLYHVNAKPLSFSEIKPVSKSLDLIADENKLENEYIIAKFDDNGLVTIIDKETNKVAVSSSNVLSVYNEYEDCWDESPCFKKYYCGRFELKSHYSYIYGNKAIRECTYSFNKSTIIQKIILTADSKVLSFETNVNWNETQKMLRAEFIPTVKSLRASCNIQFGYIERPTYSNTVQDFGKYEVSMQKYVDISDSSYGVAILNDSKYACNVKDEMISVNLLRSQMYPCINCDKGSHTFKYAVYPHMGTLEESDVVRKSIEYNYPLEVYKTKPTSPLFTINGKNVFIETIKKAENTDQIVLRIYEATNSFENVVLKVNDLITSVYESDLLENKISDNLLNNGEIELSFTPFEIKTLICDYKKEK